MGTVERVREVLRESRARSEQVGNGNGAYLSDMTEEEYERYMHEEAHGWKGFYNKVFRRGGGV